MAETYFAYSRHATKEMDATFDDAFTAGFWFGRYGLAVVDQRYAEKRWDAVCRREYERGERRG